MDGYIYLLWPREFKNSKNPIYKIGKTQDICCRKINKRFTGYPKDSTIILLAITTSVDETEIKLIHLFNELFEKQANLGIEYFKGDCNKMVSEILKNINHINVQEVEQKPKSDNAELRQIFNYVYSDLRNLILGTYNISHIRSLYDVCGLSNLYNIISPYSNKKTKIDIDMFVCEIKKLYENPSKNKIVTQEQYHSFCGIINALSRLITNINTYEYKRLLLHDKDSYIIIKLTKPVISISPAVYKNKIQKCNDFNLKSFYVDNFPF